MRMVPSVVGLAEVITKTEYLIEPEGLAIPTNHLHLTTRSILDIEDQSAMSRIRDQIDTEIQAPEGQTPKPHNVVVSLEQKSSPGAGFDIRLAYWLYIFSTLTKFLYARHPSIAIHLRYPHPCNT